MRGMSTAEMAAVYQPTIERANQIFKFMRTQSRKNNLHTATQQLMMSVLGGNFAQYTNPLRYLIGKNAVFVSNAGPPMVFALVDNSGFWQAHEVTVGRLEDRGQCNGITKAGNRCKVGQKTSSVLYVSWRDTDGKCYCKSHAPEGAVHITKSQFKWELEAKKAQEGTNASPQVIHRNRRKADHEELRSIHAAAKAAGLVKPRLMTTQEWSMHLKDLVRKGELGAGDGDFGLLTINEPSPPPTPEPVSMQPISDLQLEQDAIVAREILNPTPEPVVTSPPVLEQEICIHPEDGVWIDGVEFIPKSQYKNTLEAYKRVEELVQAITDYCDGDLTRNDLKDVADRG